MLDVGLVGYGYWGPKLARYLARQAGCRLRAICELSSERLATAAAAFPQARLLQDWQELLDDRQVDAVVIATPANAHFDLAMAALKADKHVLVEKPMALASEAAVAMIEEARRRNLVLMVDHTYVYSPAIAVIRNMLVQGSLGRVRGFQSLRSNVEGGRHDADVLWDLAAHDLSILEYLFPGAAHSVQVTEADGGPGAAPSRAVLSVHFPDSLIARIRVDWAAGVKQRRIEIVGSKGKVVFNDLQARKLRWYGQANGHSSDGPSATGGEAGEPLALAVGHFATCVRRREAALTGGQHALRVTELLEAASRSLVKTGSLIRLDPDDHQLALAAR